MNEKMIFSEIIDSFFSEDGDDLILCLGEMFPSKRLSYKSYIDGYCLCVDSVFEKIKSDDIEICCKDKLLYPFVFLCRQVVELFTKYIILALGEKYEPKHGLTDNYELLKDLIHSKVNDKELDIGLQNISSYLCAINEIDDYSIKSRYPEDKKGEIYYDSFPHRRGVNIEKFYNAHLLYVKQMKAVEEMICDMGLIDYSKLVDINLVDPS